MTDITIQVGDEEIPIDLDLANFTLREAMALEAELGGEAWDALAAGQGMQRPSVLEALVWVKVHKARPDLERDQIDFDLGALADLVEPPKSVARSRLMRNLPILSYHFGLSPADFYNLTLDEYRAYLAAVEQINKAGG